MPFWPTSTGSSKQVIASIAGTSLESQPFHITETYATFLHICHEVRLTVCMSDFIFVSSCNIRFLWILTDDLSHCPAMSAAWCRLTLCYINTQESANTCRYHVHCVQGFHASSTLLAVC